MKLAEHDRLDHHRFADAVDDVGELKARLHLAANNIEWLLRRLAAAEGTLGALAGRAPSWSDEFAPSFTVTEAAEMVVATWKTMPESVRVRLWVDFQAQLGLLERAVAKHGREANADG